ncbi:hypothetical protein [uncultured Flavobacterium sp.]|uniref:hypothetical protein n=1 Tax=uncultured Flavobacterium sp. TaxID=165435 RepID=UPI0025DB773B|nr:hypothetical protein [uncultured Flavobacterium sp.]
MKNKFLSALAVVSFFAFTSCSDDDSSDVLSGETKRYIESLEVTSNDDPTKNRSLHITYDNEGRVNTATDNTDAISFSYDGNNLSNITGGGEDVVMGNVMTTIYDGYEFGEVLIYDDAGNPISLRLFKRNDWDNSISASYIATVSYDSNINPYFATLEAAGIIEVLDNVDLNFSMTPDAEELVKAKLLLPVNNGTKVVIRDEDTNEVTSEVTVVYQYNSDNYPDSAVITEKDNNNFINTFSAVYTYKQ